MLPQAFYKNLGYGVWLLLLVMSMLFYQERAFFMDAGFQLFNMINEEVIQIYHFRFVTAIPQILPFVLLKLKAPLWILALSFSMSYILFFLLIYHLLVRYLNNVSLGWVLLFLFTLISLDSFYHMQSEFYIGLSLLILSFGLVLNKPELKNNKQLAALLFLLICIGFSHKLSLIFFLFFWSFFWLNKKALRHRRYYMLLAVFVGITLFKSIYFTNWYEVAKQADFKTHLFAYFPNYHTLPSNFVFLQRCVDHYYMLPILLFIVTVFYVLKRNWLKLMMVWCFTVGFILLYNISDTKAVHRFYSEVSYLPVIIFVTTPFLFDITNEFSKKIKYLPVVLIVVLLVRIGTIYKNHEVFRNNFDWISSKMIEAESMHTNRVLINEEAVPKDTVLMNWGVPFTTMHLMAVEGAENAGTVLVMSDFNWYKEWMKEGDLFFSPFHKVFKSEDLNEYYYRLKDAEYKMME